jgi:hypothetical protein
MPRPVSPVSIRSDVGISAVLVAYRRWGLGRVDVEINIKSSWRMIITSEQYKRSRFSNLDLNSNKICTHEIPNPTLIPKDGAFSVIDFHLTGLGHV